MDKKLKNYIEEITKASKHPSAELIEYHKAMTAQFQHERFIHLVVTLFFALFLIIFFALFLFATLSLPGSSGVWVTTCLGIITLILLIVTVFYIRHYYQLENGTQKLEDITKKLYKRD
ncbi:hypothetical protein J6X15_02445 [Candidatus Saccharibacteria bacterium]|nr:hypothetical protein [Candidatus Saccharibacteria bacterium]MBP5656420.1 hypothetical protein [Candidatus Saccharibacteria bacterium]